MKKILIITIAVILTLVLGTGFYLHRTLTFVEKTEMAFGFNALTGESYIIYTDGDYDGFINKDFRTGWIKRGFFDKIYTIDLLPFQVCLKGEGIVNDRVSNCKLVRFNPEGLYQLINNHGYRDYNSYTLKQILFLYSYDDNNDKYKFIKIESSQKSIDNGQTDTTRITN